MAAVLDLGVDLDAWPWVWLGLAVLFALIELTVLAGTFVLLPFAISAFFAALAGWYDASIEVQWAIFAVGGGVLFALFFKLARRFIRDHDNPEGVGADRLVGMTAIVTAPIDPDDVDRRGRVKVAGEEWGALITGPGGVIPAGVKVRVRSMAGTRVVVERLVDDAGLGDPPPTGPPQAPPAAPSGTSDPSIREEPT